MSLVVYVLVLMIAVNSGGAMPLFSDTAFPTIFAYVMIPSLLLTIACSLPKDREQNIVQIVNSLNHPNNRHLVSKFYSNLGDLALWQGVIVFVINLISLLSNTTSVNLGTHFGTGLAHALMSIFIGLAVRMICKSIVFRIDSGRFTENQ